MADQVQCGICGAQVHTSYAICANGVWVCMRCDAITHQAKLRRVERGAVDLAWRKGRAVEDTASDIKAHIADEAKRIVMGARRANYGTPENNFERIARFWTAYMQNTGRDVTITAADVSPLMRLMKEARLCETPDHLDSHVDLVGYTLTGAEVNGVKP